MRKSLQRMLEHAVKLCIGKLACRAWEWICDNIDSLL
jgi:hypothetical protein